ncbi:DUF5908 family protein [Ulvibacter litoralis]|uniref:Uncharacterized protein n=1 Tax=Ulvibacter litoralis TaxID=227084 RepID=A0A1G7HI41_9FLAO|nr:DUF5908 family protein [Ulvibacter litoralis]GHC57929.1 hypothetical protein GCM10008083_23210 [Ulvibacter litoralis]SDF00177.1 hypothetical protein SAMN05421855_104111 [Ulvibacter litoralis]
MPIEIKELIIKVTVNDPNQTNASAEKKSGEKAEEIMRACIEQVLEIQNRKKER